MARIKIKDLPKDMKILENELRSIHGGIKRSPVGIVIESAGPQEKRLPFLYAPFFRDKPGS